MPIVDIMFEKPTFFWVFLQCKVQRHLTQLLLVQWY